MGAFALWFCDERLGNQPSWCHKRFSSDPCGSRWVCGWHLAEVQRRTDRGQQEWDCHSAPGGRDLSWGRCVTLDCTVCLSSPTPRGAQGQRGWFCEKYREVSANHSLSCQSSVHRHPGRFYFPGNQYTKSNKGKPGTQSSGKTTLFSIWICENSVILCDFAEMQNQ